MNKILNRFTITKLYGERNVTVDFSSNIKIIVAENGYGKTTVLNALYGVLSGDISKLRKIDFETIEIEFSDNEKYILYSSDLRISIEKYKENAYYEFFNRKIGESAIYDLIESAQALNLTELKRSPLIKKAGKKLEMPSSHLANMLQEMVNTAKGSISNQGAAKEILNRIRLKFPFNIVYLPTYRRVEQDFKELAIDDDISLLDDNSINFGMRDVDIRFKEITKEIITSSVEWFSKVNGQMLSQLVDGFKIDDDVKQSIDNPDAIKIVLDRIGNNIEEDYKEKIINLIETKEIYNGHDPLVYFISNLVKVYAQQKHNDKAIQDFSEVCNRYLVDKKIDYNESKVTINIVRRKNNKPVNIETLSSGEKQIISLFARLYLKRENNLAIFYDEPELSLSLEWQKTLLPDILESNKCSFLFTTTHSPFVFENYLVSNTVDLSTYIEEL